MRPPPARPFRAGGSLRTLLVGRDRAATLAGLGLAVVLAPLVAVAYELLLSRHLGCVVLFPPTLALAIPVGAAAFAYRCDGLLVCWALGAGAGTGFDAYHYVFGITHRPLAGRIVDAATSAPMPVAGAVLATVGFAAGAGLRRLVDRYRGRSVPG